MASQSVDDLYSGRKLTRWERDRLYQARYGQAAGTQAAGSQQGETRKSGALSCAILLVLGVLAGLFLFGAWVVGVGL